MSRTTPTIDLPRNKVRVVKPNQETGEIIERVLQAEHFKDDGDAPTFPPLRPRRPKPPTGSLGWIVVQWPEHLEAIEAFDEAEAEFIAQEATYWAYFATKLTRQERRDLKRGTIIAVIRPVEPRWEKGDVLPLGGKFSARVESVKRVLAGWRTTVMIEDFRAFYMKAVVGGSSQPKTDEHGYAIPVDPATADTARQDGAYTQTESQAVPDGGEILDNKLYERIHKEREMHNALSQSRGRAKVSKIRLERRLQDALAAHRTSTARHVKRQLESLEKKEAAAVSKNASAATV